MENINDELEKRKQQQAEYRKELEQDAIRAAQKAEQDRIEEDARIKKLLERKGVVATELDSRQKLHYREVYSRPLYSFNEVMHTEQMKREDLAFHLEREESDFQTDVKQTLIDRVSALELQLQSDLGKHRLGAKTFDEDQRSYHDNESTSSAGRRFGGKVGTSLLKKIKKTSNGDTGFRL